MLKLDELNPAKLLFEADLVLSEPFCRLAVAPTLSYEELAEVWAPQDPKKVLSRDIDLFLKDSMCYGEVEELVE